MGFIPNVRGSCYHEDWPGPVRIAQNISATAVAIITTVIHPRILETRPITLDFTIFRLLHINIRTIRSGTATTPFNTAEFNSALTGLILHLRLAVTRHEHHACELMLRHQVTHKAAALCTRGIAKAQGGGITLVNHNHAFEPTSERWELIRARHLESGQLVSADDLHRAAGAGAAQPLPGRFSHIAGLRQFNTSLLRRFNNGARQGMF